jgi:gliding motility-associated-like protein
LKEIFHFTISNRFKESFFRLLAILLFCGFYTTRLTAQSCPPNIDFENGNFDNWTCYTGTVSAQSGQNVISLSNSFGPVYDQHTMYSASNGYQADFFGGFPVNCPNGSGHSIKLGNTRGGAEAEGISYEFTIPANQNTYSLIYHYAVVFQDPNHEAYQQPRLVIEATNVSDNELITCSSFTFYPNGSLLPGFFISPVQQDTTNVWCKNWSAVTMNLNGMAGKTVRLFFKTADCTFRRHFGYAYIDVDSECSSEFVGATYCADDTAISVTAPFGYQNYNWFNSNFTQQLGSLQTIYFSPPPSTGTTIAVQVIPYNGYGCIDTFYAKLIDTLHLIANAGPDVFSCNENPVQIGSNTRPGVVYSWSPVTGLSDPNISNPRAGPLVNTDYVLTIKNFGGGCLSTDTVSVTTSIIDTSVVLAGKPAFCIQSNDSAVLYVQPNLHIQWYKDNIPIGGANSVRYKVTQSGIYYALLENDKGCVIRSGLRKITIDIPEKGIRYPERIGVIDYPMNLQARNFGGTVLWSPFTYLNNPASVTPVFNGSTEKLYTITITSIGECTTVDTQMVKVYREINFYVPSAFTPNADGTNDYLKPIAAGFKEFRYFRVYNRWGQLLFDLKSNPLGWDGKFNGVPQPVQTVVWMAEGTGINDKQYIQKGTCVLIR